MHIRRKQISNAVRRASKPSDQVVQERGISCRCKILDISNFQIKFTDTFHDCRSHFSIVYGVITVCSQTYNLWEILIQVLGQESDVGTCVRSGFPLIGHCTNLVQGVQSICSQVGNVCFQSFV
jgi:hypothetical protein